jgi:hypothetical protein
MTSDWFTSVEVSKEREHLKDEVKKLQLGNMPGNQHRVETNCVQVPQPGDDWDVYCDEITTRKEQVLRERKLTASVMQLLSSFQVYTATGSGNGSESSCKPIKQQVSVLLFSTQQRVGHESLFWNTGGAAFVGVQLPVSSKGHRG